MKEKFKGIYARLRGIITRSVVTGIDSSTKNAKVTVRDKVSDERVVELLEQYGLTSIPASEDGPEMLVLSLSGANDHLLGMAISGGSKRPTDLEAGEVMLWHRNDKEKKQRIRLLNNGEIRATAGSSTVQLTEFSFTVNIQNTIVSVSGDRVLISIDGNEFEINGTKTKTSKDVEADGISLVDHIHDKVTAGMGVSGKPKK